MVKRFTGPITLLRGEDQQLEDDDNLEQLGITEAETLKIAAIPEPNLRLNVVFEETTALWSVNSAVTLAEAKQLTQKLGIFTLACSEFDLVLFRSADSPPEKLTDLNAPLFLFGLETNDTIIIERTFVILDVKVIGKGVVQTKKVSKHARVSDVKKMVLKSVCDPDTEDVSLFHGIYKLDCEDSRSFGEIVSSSSTAGERLFVLEDRPFTKSAMLFYNGQVVTKVGIAKYDDEDDMLWRAVDQTGVPRFRIAVRKLLDPRDVNYKDYVLVRNN